LAASHCLRRGENQRDVHAQTFVRQRLARLDAVLREGDLDDDVLVDGGEVAPLAHHAGRVGGRYFGAHRALHDVTNLLQDLAVVAALLGEQRRVRRDTVDDAERERGLRSP
jgi:hypothetical protein